MRTLDLTKALAIVSTSLLVGCAAIPGADDKEQADYEQCLQDNMAVAVAWDVIERQCAAMASQNSDPLNTE